VARVFNWVDQIVKKKNNSSTIELIISINVLIAVIGIVPFILYYEPGNPNRWLCCRSPLIDVLGIIGCTIGISQMIYLFPFLGYSALKKKWALLQDIAGGMLITLILNLLFLLFLIWISK